MPQQEAPRKMICLFCPKELGFYQESYDHANYPRVDHRSYYCDRCNVQYHRSVRTNPYPDNQTEWEELNVYQMKQENFRAELYFSPTPSCVIHKDRDVKEGTFSVTILQFNHHPPNLTPFNLAHRAKIWLTFS